MDTVKNILIKGEVIEIYADDKPYPSALFLGWSGGKPIHVVAAYNSQTHYCFIVTVYKPDLKHFLQDYKTRRK